MLLIAASLNFCACVVVHMSCIYRAYRGYIVHISCIYRVYIVHISCIYRAHITHILSAWPQIPILNFPWPCLLPNSCFGSQTIPSGHFFVCLNYAVYGTSFIKFAADVLSVSTTGSSTSLPSANFPLTRASHLSRVPACIGFVSQSAKCWHGQVSCVPPSFDCPMNDPP